MPNRPVNAFQDIPTETIRRREEKLKVRRLDLCLDRRRISQYSKVESGEDRCIDAQFSGPILVPARTQQDKVYAISQLRYIVFLRGELNRYWGRIFSPST